MSKGSALVVLGLLSAFLPFVGVPAAVKVGLAVLFGFLIMALGFLVRQERLWLLRTLSGEHTTDAYTENGAPHAAARKEN